VILLVSVAVLMRRRTRDPTLTVAVDAASEYAWEKAFERTWENLTEDDTGRLQTDGYSTRQRRRYEFGGSSQ
jgi:hypothetical protein